jgi:ribose transport system substrate-binding protein
MKGASLSARRRLGAAAAVLVLACAGIAGCGDDEEGGGGGSAAAKQPELGMLLALTGIPFSTQTTDGAEDGTAAVDGKLTVTGPPTIDPTTAIKQFNDMVATRPDGIVIFPIPADLWVAPLSRAADRGIKLNAIHVPTSEGSKVPMYVGMREKEAAAQLAQRFVEALGPDAKGEIVLGIGPAGEPVNENRILGYKETFARELPDVKVIGPITTGNEPVKNLEAWTQVFNRYPDALAYLGTTDQDSSSLAKLKDQRGGATLVGAFDPSTSNGALQAIADGRMLAGVGQQPYIRGYIAARVLGEAVKADKAVPEGWIDTGTEIIAKDNVAEITEREASLDATRAYYEPMIDEMFANGLDSLDLKPLADVALDPIPQS